MAVSAMADIDIDALLDEDDEVTRISALVSIPTRTFASPLPPFPGPRPSKQRHRSILRCMCLRRGPGSPARCGEFLGPAGSVHEPGAARSRPGPAARCCPASGDRVCAAASAAVRAAARRCSSSSRRGQSSPASCRCSRSRCTLSSSCRGRSSCAHSRCCDRRKYSRRVHPFSTLARCLRDAAWARRESGRCR